MKRILMLLALTAVAACGGAARATGPAAATLSCGAWHGLSLVDSAGNDIGDTAICVQPL